MTFLPLIEIILVEPAVCILRWLISHCGWFHPHNILGRHTGNKCAMSRQWPHSRFLSDHPISPLVVGNGLWSHEYEESNNKWMNEWSMTNVIIRLKSSVQIYNGYKSNLMVGNFLSFTLKPFRFPVLVVHYFLCFEVGLSIFSPTNWITGEMIFTGMIGENMFHWLCYT